MKKGSISPNDVINLEKGAHIHLIAICGTAMGALAGMLKASGYHITGSDENVYPPMSEQLIEQEIHVFKDYSPSHLSPKPDLVIIGNAMSRGNPEVEHVLTSGISYTSMAAALDNFFIRQKESLVVTGTHGKTTTTSLLAWLLEKGGADPSFFVGGVPKNWGQGWKKGDGKHFVIEGDEYDTSFFDKESKFLHYRPEVAIITSIEFDHADIFDSLEEIKSAFMKFSRLLPQKGLLVIAGNDNNVSEIAQLARCTVESYGIEGKYTWNAKQISHHQGHTIFDVEYQQSFWGSFRSPLLGNHNLLNTLASLAVAYHAGLSPPKIQEGLETFLGIKRRQEIIGVPGGITIIDDFAHHPTAVKETLSAIKTAWPQNRLWAVFEPRTNTSRRNIFQEAYTNAFSAADHILIADVFSAAKIAPEERLDPNKIVEGLKATGKQAFFMPHVDGIIEHLLAEVQPGDVVAILSNGAFSGIHNKLREKLRQQFDRNSGAM